MASNWQETYEKLKKRKEALDNLSNNTPLQTVTKKALANTKVSSKDDDDEERTWFRSGAFDDGYQIGDITKTILGTGTELYRDAVKGALNIGEGTIDTLAMGVGKIGSIFSDDIEDTIGDFVKKDIIDEEKMANRMTNQGSVLGWANNLLNGNFSAMVPFNVKSISKGETIEENSLLGEKADSLAESAGQLAGTVGLQALGVPWWLTTSATSFGREAENALKNDATYNEAMVSAGVSALAETLTEKLSGGISFGGKTLDVGLKNALTGKITNKVAQTLTKFGIDAAGEGFEEVLSEAISNVGRLSYEDKGLKDALFSEEAVDGYIEAAIGGAVLGGGFNVGRTVNSIKTGRDYDTGYTQNEQSVIDAEVQNRIGDKKLTNKEINKITEEVKNDFEKGYISTDTIESTLGGDTFNQLKSLRDNKSSLESEIAELENKPFAELTVKQKERLDAIREEIKTIDTNTLESKLQSEMADKIKSDGYLQRSYQEKANKSQNFTYDSTKITDENEKSVYESATKVMNNTNRSHEFVEKVAKIAKDKGTNYGFINNTELKSLGFDVGNKQINGLVRNVDGKQQVLINVDSAKALNTIVGHETTHLLEGTQEYNELQEAIFNYAKEKGDFEQRQASLYSLYKDIENADINTEITADLVGDYLFTDENFINSLSTQKPTVFQKVKELIDDLVVRFTGTKEEKALREVQKKFKEAYKQNATQTDADTKYSVSDSQGRTLTEEQQDYFKDSKVRDEDGNLEVLYNGSGNHTVYLPGYMSDENLWGKGVYLTPYKDIASSYGNDVKETYVNITKPISHNTKMPFKQYNEFYKAINDGEEAYIEEYDMYDNDFDLLWDSTNKGSWADYADELKKHTGYDGIIAEEIDGDRTSSMVIAFQSNQIKNVDNTNPTSDEDIRYSLTDNQGRELSKEQQEYFKETKVRDDDGSLTTVYHTTPNAGFTVFQGSEGQGNYRFGKYGDSISYFTDHKEMSESYSKNSENAGTYEGYLNLKNPLEVDAEGRYWNKVTEEYSQETYDKFNSLDEIERDYLMDLASWEDARLFRTTMEDANQDVNVNHKTDMGEDVEALASAYKKLEGTDLYDVFVVASNDFSNESMQENAIRNLTTNDIVEKALEDGSYDGVIIKNVIDYGSGIKKEAGNVYVAFNSNQFKNADNTNPTTDKDIRYSLSEDSNGNELKPNVIKWAENSKARDSEGHLKVLYHGTATGEFTVFDKNKANPEGDWGAGFYLTDSDFDVETNYEDGGADFDNKVARLAEQIEQEQDMDYSEAENEARAQLYKGSYKITSYVKLENPAIVGETYLFDRDTYAENYNIEDYDSEEDFDYDVDQLISDDIDTAIWAIEREYDFWNGTDEIRNVLWEEAYNGGIEIQHLKDRLNELSLETDEGFVANDVARIIIESLGYDGIIDPTVSTKWNMTMDSGTTHYIVFKPNQIKNITNENPTDNQDINLSLSQQGEQTTSTGNYNVYGEDVRLEQSIAPLQEEIKTLTETVQELKQSIAPDSRSLTTEDLPMLEQQYEEAFNNIDESNMPIVEDVAPDESGTIETQSLFETRDYEEVGNRKVNAYQYDHPEVKPYFQAEAQHMLYDLQNSTKGERMYNDDLYYSSGGEQGYFGTKRHTTEDISELLDGMGGKYKYTYAEIEKGLNAIIKDEGAENNAVSKRIEMYLDQRLRDGYTTVDGVEVPANQEYIEVAKAIEINDFYNSIPIGEAPVEDVSNSEYIAPAKKQVKVEAIRPAPTQDGDTHGYRLIRVKTDSELQTEANEHIAEILAEEPKTENKRNKRKAAILAANVLDKGLVFENVSLKNKNRELMGKWDYTLTSEARGQNVIGQGHYEYDPISKTTRQTSKSLNDIRQEVDNTGLTKEFYEYMYHKHNYDRMRLQERYDIDDKPVFGYNVTALDSQIKILEFESKHPEFMSFAQDVYDYLQADRQQLVKEGVISQETADLWQDMYPHYVPIRRVDSQGLNINVPLDTGRTGVNAPIKRATGGNTDILPLFDTMAQRTLQTYRATAKNSFGVELMNTLGTRIETQETNVDDVIDNIDNQEGLLQEGKNGNKPTFTVFENGEKVTFEITEDMYDALKPLSDSSILSKTYGLPNQVSNFHRGVLTQYNPVFMLTNAIKDSQDILINSQHAVKTYSKIPESLAQILSKGYWYQEYMNNGGEQNSYFDSADNTFKTENTGVKKLLDLPPLKQIAQLNDFVEKIPRLAEYIASRESGRSVEVSMLDAARVTTNFKAGGNLTKFANRNGATFLNASVQGAMQQVRNVREANANGIRGWANLATKFAMAGLPAYLLNSLLWDDDEEYEELSDYVKQNYYVVAKDDNGNFIRIPKGRTLAVIQEGIQQMSNLITGDDEADLKTFIDLFLTNLAPNSPIDNNILSPIKHVIENKAWHGSDIVPMRLQDLPAAEQYDESTDSFSRWLGEKTNISPMKINYVLDQYSGGVGDVVLPMLTPEAKSDADTLGEQLLAPLKSKFTTNATMNNQNVADFYDTSEELTTNAKKSNATDKDVLSNKYINSVKAEMNELYKEKREIQNSDLPNSEKYNRVLEVQKQINELSKNALNEYENVNISSNYATVGDRHYKVNNDGEWEKINDKQLEKQNEVTSYLDISANDYWGNKEEYDYAYENPSKYAVATTIGGYSTYKQLTKDLYEIKADKDSDGKSISGSRKEKVFDYINNLDLDFEQRVILAKLEYPSYDEYNYEIIEYLNNREDISYEQTVNILTELGFTVSSNGNISWD